MKAFQDYYPEELSHCYGCGRNNPHGHQLKSYWENDRTVARFMPEAFHTAIPGYVYGGLIAALVDCHGTGTAAAAMSRAQGRALDSEPPLRFVTASLHVDYLAPTPQGVELVLYGYIVEVGQRKVVVDITVEAGDTLCARGRVVAVLLPDSMAARDQVTCAE
jgi:uncharacterized protein (TIGR00369 family)